MSKVKQMLLLHQNGMSNRKIARGLEVNKGTINEYIHRAKLDPIGIDGLLKLDDPILERRFFAGNPAYCDQRIQEFLSELPHIKDQLEHPHVSKFLAWEEYRSKYPDGYGRSQFYYHLKQNLVAGKTPVTILSNTYNPGEKLFVDYAGKPLSYIDPQTGETIAVQVFVACLPHSDYAYAICVSSQRVEDFVYALRMCLEYMGGVPSIVVPDNLKAAVIRADRYEPELNKAFEDMGNHYGFAVLPARSGRPKDKALVENQVKLVYKRVYAKLRNRQFYSLGELNKAVEELITLHNQTRMQQRPYFREERFHANEKAKLRALPEVIYEVKKYAQVKVLPTGTVYLSCDKHYYSVPYELIGRKASVIFTRSIVKIYVENRCVATHIRVYEFGHTLLKEHLSPNSLAYTERSPEYYCNKAKKLSASLEALFQTMFNNKRSGVINELYYRSCEKMLRLQANTATSNFEAACKICLDNQLFRGENLENVIKSLAITEGTEICSDIIFNNHENTRGENYYK